MFKEQREYKETISTVRFRCVSKLWYSIITSQDFRNQHLSISVSAPPRLLIAFEDFYGNKLLVVTLPNPNASSSSSSSCRVPYSDLSLLKLQGKLVFNTVRGLICLGSRVNVEICNPSTTQLHIFRQFKFKLVPKFYPRPYFFFGYDAFKDQYKVLTVDSMCYWRSEHKVVTLGGQGGWRDVPCVTCPHTVQTSGLYMNGTLYYGASRMDTDSPKNSSIIMSFNVRFETFNIIKVPSTLVPMGYEYMWQPDMWTRTDKTLINYQGKIGVVENPREGSFRMWIVEDAEKEEWSMDTFHLPQSAAGLDFKVMDTFHTGEICMVTTELSDPFSLFYYNLERKSMRSVIIEGLPIPELNRVHDISVTVSDHCESFMSLKPEK